jgi:hypothetical protein
MTDPQRLPAPKRFRVKHLKVDDDVDMAGGPINNMADPTNPQDATTKSYVDGAITGHRAPVAVPYMISDANQGGVDPVGPHTAGDAYIVNNWATQTDGDLVEWSGTAWVVVVANIGGAPPDKTRVVVKSGPGGSFVGRDTDIGEYNAGAGTWAFTNPVDGDQVYVVGTGGVYENQGFIFDAGTGQWVLMSSAIAHNATSGKQGGAGTEYYHLTQAEEAGLTGGGATTLHTHDHTNITGVTSDQHHPKSHAHDGVDGSGTVAHSATTGRTTDDHHAKSHAHDGVDGSGTVAHGNLTGVSANQHHNQAHAVTGTDHTTTELDTAKVLKPNGTGGVVWGADAGDVYGRGLYPFSYAGAFSGSQTGYWAVWGAYTGNASAETRFPTGRVLRLTVNVTSNTLNSASTFELWKNGASTGVSVSFASTETGRKTVTATHAIADGDLLCVRGVLGGTGGQTIQPKEIVIEFEGEV